MPKLGPWAAIGWTAALAVMLVWMAIPRLTAGLAWSRAADAPLQTADARLQTDGARPGLHGRALHKLQTAAGRHESAKIHGEIGAFRFAQAATAGYASRHGRAFLDQGIDHLRRALVLAPGQPYAWTQLAHGLVLRDGTTKAAGRALAMAIATAPYEPRLAATRLDLAFVLRRQLDDDAKALIAGQITALARISPKALAEVAKRRYALGAVRRALAGSTGLLDRFDDAYLKL